MVCRYHGEFGIGTKKLSAIGDVYFPISAVIHHTAHRAEMLILK
ncbi:hypothetical protein A4U88_1466 [Serratia marcescens]|nr:hypothetical protein A4U88_1466 [Serratia marcescens]